MKPHQKPKGPVAVLYHGACRDGWCAAWAASHVYPDAELIAVYYGQAPPAIEPGTDNDPGCPSRAPWPVRYIEDRDLWRWALPCSREVNAYLGTIPYTGPPHRVGSNLAAWTEAAATSLALAIDRGATAQLALRAYVEAVAANAVMRPIGAEVVPSVNAPQHEISELLEHLLDRYPGAPYVHGWWQRADGRLQHSLRSREADVSEVARRFGGGGHKLAAGFETEPAAHHVAIAMPLERDAFKGPGRA